MTAMLRARRRLRRYLPHLAGLVVVVVTLAVTLALDSAWRSERAREDRYRVTAEVGAARDRLESAIFARVLLARNFVGYLENNPNFTDRDFRLLARDLVGMEQGILAVRLAKGGIVSHLYPFEGRVHLLGRPLEDTLPAADAKAVDQLVRQSATRVTSPLEGEAKHQVLLYLNPVYLTVVGLSGSGPYWGMAVFELDLQLLAEEAGLARGDTAMAVRAGADASAGLIWGPAGIFARDAVTADLAAPWGRWQVAARTPVRPPLRSAPWLLGLAVSLALGFTTWLAAHQLMERIRTQERYRELVQNARSIILRVTPGGIITFFNEYAQEFFGFTEQEVLGRHLLQTIVPPRDAMGRDLEAHILDVLARPDDHATAENENIRKDGTRAWVSWANRPFTDAAGNLTEILCVGTDLTARQEMEARLRMMAVSDSLTGVSNRRYFLELAEAELQRSRRYGRPLAMLMLDLDHFKAVNDTHGHEIGDKALRMVAKAVAGRLRDVDALGRMGGEEFAVLFPETGMEQALKVAERIRQVVELSGLDLPDGQRLGVTVSVGVAVLADEDTAVDTLLRRADLAMYRAKQSGRNRVEAQ